MKKISIKAKTGKIKGSVWGQGNAKKILALHGWLDNAHTFYFLAPLLAEKGYEVVAVDLPGHGKSQHRAKGHFLHIYDYILDIQDVIEQLNWNKFTFLGHSMGAAMAQMYTTSYPEKVEKLIMIENLGAVPSYQKGSASSSLKIALEQWQEFNPQQKRFYESPKQALLARLKATPMKPKFLKPMVKRGLKKTEKGYQWRTDKRLKIRSLFRLSEEAIQDFLKETKVETLLILAKPASYALNYPAVKERIKALNPKQTKYINGHHHFHLDKSKETSEAILGFLTEK